MTNEQRYALIQSWARQLVRRYGNVAAASRKTGMSAETIQRALRSPDTTRVPTIRKLRELAVGRKRKLRSTSRASAHQSANVISLAVYRRRSHETPRPLSVHSTSRERVLLLSSVRPVEKVLPSGS